MTESSQSISPLRQRMIDDMTMRKLGREGTSCLPSSREERVWEQLATVRGSYIGLGMFLEVALHPEFDENGWIYLSHTERCQLDCGSWLPVSMVRVVRGKIRDGRWVDEEIVWHVHHDHYTVVPDGVACGRLAFDGRGHLFLSVGGKSTYDNLHVLDTPYGKIHRVRDDGTVPEDQPVLVACRLQTRILYPGTQSGATGTVPRRAWKPIP